MRNIKKMHIDEFIDFGVDTKNSNEMYARWVLMHHRLPAVMQIAFKEIMREHELFCIYDNNTYRVTGASSLGDIWLHSELNSVKAKAHYEKRVNVAQCSNWSKK